MKVYLDSDDFHYIEVNSNKNKNDKNKYELSKEHLGTKKKLDRGSIAAILYSLGILGTVTIFTIYTIIQIVFS